MLVVIVSGLHWRVTILVSKCFVIVAQFRSTDVVCHINRVCHWLSTRVWRNLLFTTHSIVLFHLHQCPCLPWLQLPVDTIAFHPVLPFYLFFHILISSFPFSNLNKIKYIFFLLTIQWGRVVSTGLQAGDSKLTKSMLKDFQAGGRYLQTLAIKWERKSRTHVTVAIKGSLKQPLTGQLHATSGKNIYVLSNPAYLWQRSRKSLIYRRHNSCG